MQDSSGARGGSLRTQIHVAIAAPVWTGLAVAATVITRAGPVSRADWETAATGLTLAAAAFWIALIVVAWVRRRPPFHEPAPDTSIARDLALALIIGLGLGAHAGLLRSASFGGAHGAAVTVYFLLLPTALLVSCSRSRITRALAEITAIMAGVELGAQVGLSYSKWKRLRWWDDITGIDAAYLGGAFAVALVWWTICKVAPGVGRRPRVWHSREDADAPAPRKA